MRTRAAGAWHELKMLGGYEMIRGTNHGLLHCGEKLKPSEVVV